MNRKSGIHFSRPSDKEFHNDHLAVFRGESLEQLVERFNREVRIGITGAHMQMVYIATLSEAISERTGENTLDQDGPMLRPLHYLSIANGKLVQHSEN